MIVKQMGTWILIFTNFVPISLITTLELIRFWQAVFVEWDWRMCCDISGVQAKAQASNLIEEIGQLDVSDIYCAVRLLRQDRNSDLQHHGVCLLQRRRHCVRER